MPAEGETAEKKQAEAPTATEQQEGEEETPAAEPDQDVARIAALAPDQALLNFLPETLLGRLELELNDLLEAGRLLAPTVRRLVDDIRKSI